MSEPLPSKGPSNSRIILFMVILSFVCALVLSVMASVLSKPIQVARELDRNKQMMIAARILDHKGYFLMKDEEGKVVPAKYEGKGLLVPGSPNDTATNEQIISVFNKRLKPFLVDDEGKIKTFEEEGIDEKKYLADYKESGYYNEPLKLIYEILPNKADEEGVDPIGYIVPINGYGLWNAIYGYMAIETDGNSVIGISWYEQGETPGLGANIADEPWQSQFPGKNIFQPSASGEADLKTAPVGIIVVKGKVAEVMGDVPKSKSAVDGMAGATLTGNGVTQAYKEVLSAYRPFFIKINEQNKGAKNDTP